MSKEASTDFMSDDKAAPPFAATKLTKLLAARLEDLKNQGVSYSAVSRQLGYRRPAPLMMMRTGDIPVPLTKVREFASLLGIPLLRAYCLVFEQHHGVDMSDVVQKIDGAEASPAEKKVIKRISDECGACETLSDADLDAMMWIAKQSNPTEFVITQEEKLLLDVLRSRFKDGVPTLTAAQVEKLVSTL